jgi:class 3 adenylate cyclase
VSAASPQVAAIGDGIGISLASLRRFWAVAARSNSSRALPAPVQPDAERRQLTVMFCDLVGSTTLSTRFDPEDLRELIGDYDRAISETVGDFAGFVAKYMGDGGAGLFRVTYHRLGALRARWHCAVPGPSTQARHQHTWSVFHTRYNPEITIINLYLFRDSAPVTGLNFPSGRPS